MAFTIGLQSTQLRQELQLKTYKAVHPMNGLVFCYVYATDQEHAEKLLNANSGHIPETFEITLN